jgi:nucleotide-binding universal stress UspA family protein
MKILLAFDGSGYSRTSLFDLQYAGLPSKADVLIISVSEIWMPPTTKYDDIDAIPDSDVAEFFRRCYEQIDRNLAETKEVTDEAKETLQKSFPRWTIKTETVSGSPKAVILARASEFKPDLLVLGARGLSSNGIGKLGSIAQKALIEADCPVRIARGKGDAVTAGTKIFIGFNNTPGAMAAVDAVAARQWPRNPEIRLVIVTDPLFPLVPGHAFQLVPGWSEKTIRRGERKWTESLAANALQTLGDAGLAANLFVYSGNPRMILVRESEKWGADSIFIGANSFPQSQSSTLGSVASAVAARAFCSVEVVRKMAK